MQRLRQKDGGRFARIQPKIHSSKLPIVHAQPWRSCERLHARRIWTSDDDFIPHDPGNHYLAEDLAEYPEHAQSRQVDQGRAVRDDDHAARSLASRADPIELAPEIV